MKWAYGITTVPSRFNDLLPQTVESLKAAGFDKPRIFVDGLLNPKDFATEWNFEITTRFPSIRTFGNWALGLYELSIRDPNATHYAMFQDDFITYKNLRQYLESCEYPEKGYWNLYTFPSNQTLCPKDYVGWYPSNQRGLGAVALVFSRQAVMTLFMQPHFIERPLDALRGWRSIDGGIVTALKQAGWREYVHNPSLVQHMGVTSSMGNGIQQQATSFRGADYDALRIK